MVETKTAGGKTERGSANQRHFVRSLGGVDGAHPVCSHSTGHVTIRVEEGAMGSVLDLVAKWGGEPTFGLSSSKEWQYTSGGAAVEVKF